DQPSRAPAPSDMAAGLMVRTHGKMPRSDLINEERQRASWPPCGAMQHLRRPHLRKLPTPQHSPKPTSQPIRRLESGLKGAATATSESHPSPLESTPARRASEREFALLRKTTSPSVARPAAPTTERD